MNDRLNPKVGRRDVQHRLAEWRTRYRNPERAAFQAAVARGRA
jgi:hypothetical protein